MSEDNRGNRSVSSILLHRNLPGIGLFADDGHNHSSVGVPGFNVPLENFLGQYHYYHHGDIRARLLVEDISLP